MDNKDYINESQARLIYEDYQIKYMMRRVPLERLTQGKRTVLKELDLGEDSKRVEIEKVLKLFTDLDVITEGESKRRIINYDQLISSVKDIGLFFHYEIVRYPTKVQIVGITYAGDIEGNITHDVMRLAEWIPLNEWDSKYFPYHPLDSEKITLHNWHTIYYPILKDRDNNWTKINPLYVSYSEFIDYMNELFNMKGE